MQLLSLALAAAWALGLCGEAPAAAAKPPYRLRLVLHFARHRLLTPVFRERVESELRDGLQAALGDLAEVTVVRTHPRLYDAVARGLQKALDGWNERSEYKDHFVFISYAGVNYEIRARQHDGSTGQVSPVVRTGRTRDREFVAKAAALLVTKDFGMTGTVASAPDPQGLVTVKLDGAGGGVPLERWVKKDEVFALASAPKGAGTGQAVPETLLQVREPPKDGRCACRLFSRYQLREVRDLRCIKLGTVRAPVRLRVVREGKEAGGLVVEIRRQGFRDETDTLWSRSGVSTGADTSRDGDKGRFTNMAFVSIFRPPHRPVAKVPVAVVGDEPVVIKVKLAGAESDPLFGYRLLAWRRAVSDSLRVQITLFKELGRMASKGGDRAKTLATARAGLERSRDDYKRLKEGQDDLFRGVAKPPDVSQEEQRLKELREGETALKTFVTRQEEIEREENSPERREALRQVERGKLLEKDAEFGKALEIYKNVLKTFKNEDLRNHYDELRKEWEIKNDEVQKARTFIYEEWPALDTPGLEKNLENVRKAFAICSNANDYLGPRKLFLATEAHALRLTKELAELKPDVNIDDEAPARRIKELAPQLEDLARKIQVHLRKKPAAK